MSEPMRIQRALARAGVASRRKAEELIVGGHVTVNGAVAKIGQSVDPDADVIAVDGKRIAAPAPSTWLVLNKPRGTLTSKGDPAGRPTVFDIVPKIPGLTYVGRLDYLTEGLLLLTTDGEGANLLTHPSKEIERTYVALVRGDAPEAVRALERGLELEDGLVEPTEVEARKVVKARGLWELEITLREGRTREVRRICEALNLEVLRLVRTRYGPVKLGDLESGKTRPLSTREWKVIETLTGHDMGPPPEEPKKERGKWKGEERKRPGKHAREGAKRNDAPRGAPRKRER